MHQGYVKDIPYDTQGIMISNLPGRTDQQEVDMLRQNSEVQESQSSFGRGQRMKKPSSKGKEYKLSQNKNKRLGLYSRLLRKYSAIEGLLYSRKNKGAFEEELAQFNDMLKIFVAAHEECKQHLEEEQINTSDEWFN